MKIAIAALGIALVVVSSVVAFLMYRNAKDNLAMRTKQVEHMISRHLEIVSRDHKIIIEDEKKLIQILEGENKMLDRIEANGQRLQDVAAMNQKILKGLETASANHPNR